ncbi:MAG: hypothetical protein SFV51_21180 [Bryobacteraceae bacterium]|nr:hypothetical protein [Bryobacteraceae bacterium]
MTEAWLLFDESAIRSAAGNPRGAVRLLLPPMKALESISDPKSVLHDLLRKASGLTGRRLREFPLSHRIYRLADSLDSFAPLRGLAAFRSLEEDVRQIVAREGWSVLDGH